MNKTVIIIGAGGHSKVIADIIIKSDDTILGFIDDNKQANEIPFGYTKLGCLKDIFEISKNYPNAEFIIALGDNQLRKCISEEYNLKYYTAIHPNSTIAMDVEIGDGSVIMAGVVINSSTKIGKGCVINTNSCLEHDNIIEDYVHISPGTNVGGSVLVGRQTWIGIGSVISNNINICGYCVIGAGSLVLKDIHISGTYVGTPVKKIEK